VGKGLVFHVTLHPETKFAPFTFIVKEAPPAVALVGLAE
jgi:hypothetical protein